MTQVSYASTSPYSLTPQSSRLVSYLDFWVAPIIPVKLTDVSYVVEHKYTNRPELLAFDLYKSVAYWWVFAIRNPDVIKDPIYDLVAGITIFLPDSASLPSGIS